MKSFSNTYIFVFSAIMVTVVAALLSIIAIKLQPRQQKNIRIETMQSILKSVRVESTKKNTEELFQQYIIDSYVIDVSGNKIAGDSAIRVDLKKEVALIDKIKKNQNLLKERSTSPFKSFVAGFINFKEIDKKSIELTLADLINDRKLPVYECLKEGETYYVLPLRGKGLWGPVWGYIAVKSDMNTVYGAVFDHKSETPGLGAEINQSWFQADFEGKQLFKDGEFQSIEVVKGGADPNDKYGVDAISGGTITSKGVQDMIYDCLISYKIFFENQRN